MTVEQTQPPDSDVTVSTRRPQFNDETIRKLQSADRPLSGRLVQLGKPSFSQEISPTLDIQHPERADAGLGINTGLLPSVRVTQSALPETH